MAGLLIPSSAASAPTYGEIQAFSEVQRDGSPEAIQQWLAKVEYSGMQRKHRQDAMLAELERIRRAATAAEHRQDSEQGHPEDFLRHWDESSKDERKLMLDREIQRHCQAGLCCLPSCFAWLHSLRVFRRCRATWAEQARQEEALAAAAALDAPN